MTLGYTTPLYILPFDHRASFENGMFGWSGVRDEKISREAAVAEVARRYRRWVDVFAQARGAASSSDIAPGTPSATVQPARSTP